MKLNLNKDNNYNAWLTDIKTRVRQAQVKAVLSVNVELLSLYWSLGEDIVNKQKKSKWGEGLIDQLSKDLSAEFPEMKGFSRSNLMYIKKWYLFFHQSVQIVQQPVGQFVQIPWGHNIAIITNCKDIKEALYYVSKTLNHNWSRSVLVHQIESGLYKRDAKVVSNFTATLPKPQSDLAHETLKDPYVFDFLSMTENYSERDLERGLVDHLTKFLMELGSGFAFIGRQVPIQVGAQEFFIDLLFYHTQLHCYVVIELKTKNFEPEFAGKLNFYIKAVDMKLRKEGDQPTIGLLLCKTKDKLVVEYALSDIKKPIGVSEYKLTHSLPKSFKASLPTIKEIEMGLRKK